MPNKHILLLTTARSYRLPAFTQAAKTLNINIIIGVDMPAKLADTPGAYLPLDFTQPEQAVEKIIEYTADNPLAAILPTDDGGTLLAAKASAALDLPFNDEAASLAARDKLFMRQMLQAGGVPCPSFQPFPLDGNAEEIAQKVIYPCVVKPTQLSGSRGVIRANNAAEFVAAFRQTAHIANTQSPSAPPILLVESFVPGVEVALEGIIHKGELIVLALFDKPDPLDGPLFEETIYVTPSRLPASTQKAIANCTAQACQALGLRRGPIHAECRINEKGVWLIEIAGRSIGGLCGNILQFGSETSLEELILRQAAGLPIATFEREAAARGVMMIPIPQAGLLRQVAGIAAAEAIPLIEGVEITAPLNNPVVTLPAGESYLGFIFAAGEMPAAVEAALRTAYNELNFQIDPIFSLRNAGI